jgi:hypothetical protein
MDYKTKGTQREKDGLLKEKRKGKGKMDYLKKKGKGKGRWNT